MLFGKKTSTWKFYITNKALSITKQVQIVNLKEFIIATLDADKETFVVYVAIRKHEKMTINFKNKAQIKAEACIKTQT